MRIKLICVGKLKERYLKDACAEYVKRISGFGRIEIIEVQDEKEDRPYAIRNEGDRILKYINKSEYTVTLEIEGKMMSSEQLSLKISSLAVSGVSNITFVIGGSNGLAEAVKKRANLKLSLSRMTFPHQLARIILLEQIYRAFKINQGSRYHK